MKNWIRVYFPPWYSVLILFFFFKGKIPLIKILKNIDNPKLTKLSIIKIEEKLVARHRRSAVFTQLFIMLLHVCNMFVPDASWETCLLLLSYVLFPFFPPFVLKREQRLRDWRINSHFWAAIFDKLFKGQYHLFTKTPIYRFVIH